MAKMTKSEFEAAAQANIIKADKTIAFMKATNASLDVARKFLADSGWDCDKAMSELDKVRRNV